MTTTAAPLRVLELGAGDAGLMPALLDLFGEVFDDAPSYARARPGEAYLRRLLGGPAFIALAAVQGSTMVGGLAAYELPKFEQERSEIYLYDLAVAATHRRQGIASALIRELVAIAARRGAYVVFVQADRGDDAAIALYRRFGAQEDVLHFDIAVPSR